MAALRSNDEWINALNKPGQACEAALAELASLVKRGLGAALAGRSHVDETLIDECTQKALQNICDQLDRFQGRSHFIVWAQTIAVRVAFSEMHRRQWSHITIQHMAEDTKFTIEAMVDSSANPEPRTRQEKILQIVNRVINEELTDQQRKGLVGAFQIHMPPGESARRLGVDRDTFYKLIHDARWKIKQRLLEAGFSQSEILSAFSLVSGPKNH